MSSRTGNLRQLLPKAARAGKAEALSFELGKIIRQARDSFLERAFSKKGSGEAISRQLATLMEDAVCGLFAAAVIHFPDEGEHLTVAAVGGFGRGRLAPGSDIDLLFLHDHRMARQVKPMLDFILYALWDAQLTVAQMVHTPSSAMVLCKEDVPALTSFLDHKYLAGSERLDQDFMQRYEGWQRGTAADFVEAKLDERAKRVSETEDSRYLTEPNIKEGKGGLRDLDTLHWLAKYAYGAGDPESMVRTGLLTKTDAAAFRKAGNFLWSVRVHMHHETGRADEFLGFDMQKTIAERLNFETRGKMPGVERFMRQYFLTTREVGRLTGIMSAKLEEAKLKKSRLLTVFSGPKKRPLRKIRPDRSGPVDMFELRGERLNFSDVADLAARPVDMFRLYRIAGRPPRCDLHPEARQRVTLTARRTPMRQLTTPQVEAVFRDILIDTQETEAVLREMAEDGLLGRYLPAFGLLAGRMIYSLYRRFTLEEHVLRSAGVLAALISGSEEKAHPYSHKIMQATPDVLPYYLAVLLHETISAVESEDVEEARLRIRKTVRHFFKTDKAELDRVIWAATHHKLLAHTASRRSASSPDTVHALAAEVGSQAYLDMLIVLTVCHLRVAGINSWDRWIRRDITVLYEACTAYFRNGEEGLEKYLLDRRSSLRNKTIRILRNWPASRLEKLFQRLPDEFFESVTPEGSAEFVQLVHRVDTGSGQGGVSVRLMKDGFYEVQVYSRDKPGLYANIAGVIAEAGMQVRASSAFPVARAGKGSIMAANIFVFRDDTDTGERRAVGPSVETLTEEFQKAVDSSGVREVSTAARIGDRRSWFQVPSKVTLDDDLSEDCLVVEARGLDRPGLVHQLAAVFADLGISIRSAYVATYGETAVDSFYVQDLPGYKITDKRRKEVIRRRIMAVLEDR